MGDAVSCWVPTALCPSLECSIMCPELCGVTSISRTVASGGVAIDLPLGGPTTLSIPGQPPVTGDELSVVLVPRRGDAPMALAGIRLFVGGLSAVQLNTVRGEFECRADFNDSDTLSVQDIFDFLAAYFGGC